VVCKLGRYVSIFSIICTCGAYGQTLDGEKTSSLVALAADAPDVRIERVPYIAQAVLTGDEKRVTEAIDKAPETINDPVTAKDGARAGFTPLILAAALSNPKIAEILIQRGAIVAKRDDYNRSALWYAALRESAGVTRVLVEAPTVGDIINSADKDFGRTPLHLAVRGSDFEIVELLIKAGATGTQKDILGETPKDYCKTNFTVACKALQ
jgi:ankyrin repeat protein